MDNSIEEIAALPPPARVGYLLRNGLFCPTKFDVLFGAQLRQNEKSGEKDAGLRHPSDVVPFILSITPDKVNTEDLSLFYYALVPNSRTATPQLLDVADDLIRDGASRPRIEAELARFYDCSPYSILQKVSGMARVQGQDGPALWDIPPYLINWVHDVLSDVRTDHAPALDSLFEEEHKSGGARARRALKLVRAVQILTPIVSRYQSQLRVLLLSAAHPEYLSAHSDPHPDRTLEKKAECALLEAYAKIDHPHRCHFERIDDGLFFALLVYLVFCDTPESPWRYQNCNYLRRAVCWDFSFPAMIALSYATAVIHQMFFAPFYSASFIEQLVKYYTTLERYETSADNYVAPGVLAAFYADGHAGGLFDQELTIYDCAFGEFRLQPPESWKGLSPEFLDSLFEKCKQMSIDEVTYYSSSPPDDAYLLALHQHREQKEKNRAEQKMKEQQASSSSSSSLARTEEDDENEDPVELYYAVRPEVGARCTTEAEYNTFFSKEPPIVYEVNSAIKDLLAEMEATQKRRRKRRRK